MKLVLASAGVYTPEIINKVIELVGKPIEQINITIINEAYAMEHGDHRWLLDELNRVSATFKGKIEFINLLALTTEVVKERIALADIIYVIGGNTDYLMSVFNKSGFSEILPNLLKTKVYVGSSAGSMVLCRRNSTEAYQRIYGEGNDFGVKDYLGLLDISIKPHLDNPLFPNNKEAVLVEVSKGCDYVVFGLKDDSAVVVDGDKEYTIGSEPFKVLNGVIV